MRPCPNRRSRRSTRPTVLKIRSDLKVPVLTFETESDVLDAVFPTGYLPATQPDSRYFRLWEVACTSHIDSYNLSGLVQYDDGNWSSDLQLFALMSSPPTSIPEAKAFGLNISCGGTGFNAGEEHYVFNVALYDISSVGSNRRAAEVHAAFRDRYLVKTLPHTSSIGTATF